MSTATPEGGTPTFERAPARSADASAEELRQAQRWVLGYAAGLALAAAGSWLRVLLTGTFRITTSSWTFTLSSVVLGLGLALAAVMGWRLVQAAPRLPRGRFFRWALPVHLVSALAVPITSSDFYIYLAYGELQVLGKNPLLEGPTALGDAPIVGLVAERWVAQPSIYGPIMNHVFRVAADVGALFHSPVWGPAIAMKLIMLATSLVTIALTARLVDRFIPGDDGARALAIVAFSPLLVWEVTAQGHNDGVLGVALTLFVFLALAHRELLAALALAAGVYAKMTVAPVLVIYFVYLLRVRGLRALAYGVVVLVMGALLMLPFVDGLPDLRPLLSAVGGTRSHSLPDLLASVASPLGPDASAAVIRGGFIVCVIACAIALAVGAWRARTVNDVFEGSLVFLLAWAMTVPLFQSWYITWFIPLAIVIEDRRWMKLVALYAIFSVLQWGLRLDPVSTVVINVWVVKTWIAMVRTPGEATWKERPPAEPAAA